MCGGARRGGRLQGIASNGDNHLTQLAAQDDMLALDVDGFDRYFIWPRCCHAAASFAMQTFIDLGGPALSTVCS